MILSDCDFMQFNLNTRGPDCQACLCQQYSWSSEKVPDCAVNQFSSDRGGFLCVFVSSWLSHFIKNHLLMFGGKLMMSFGFSLFYPESKKVSVEFPLTLQRW